MAITANGVGSGLDINGLVSQLMSLEQRPLTLLAQKEASYQAKLSAFGQLKSVLSSLQSAASGLKDAAKFSATKATAASDAGFTASSSSSAATGSYAVEVTQLAKIQRVATSGTTELGSAGAPLSAGTLTIEYGTVTGGAFVADAERTASLEFTGSTIEELRDAINGSTTLGIKASIVNNGSVKQLVLTGTATGADKAFRLGGDVGLSYDPGVATTSADPVYSVQAAQDAKLTVDGIAISRSNNTISDAIDGVTLTLTKENPGTTSTLSVANDRTSAKSAIDAFVKAYNDAVGTLRNLTAYNAESKQSAILTGDSTARSIEAQLRNVLSNPLTGLGATNRLADIGVSFQKDGTLLVNSAKLEAALSDPERDVAAFFAGSGSIKGLAASLADKLGNLVDSDGLIAGRTTGINASIKSIDKQREALAVRLDSTEKRYRAQFTALDSLVASMTQTSNYLTQQLANLPKISSN